MVTCEIIDVRDGGVDVRIVGTDLTCFVRRAELARDRNDQRPDRFAVGEKVDARVTLFDRKARKVQVSVKALEVAEEKEAIAQYGSADSGSVARRHSRRGAQEARKPELSDRWGASRPAAIVERGPPPPGVRAAFVWTFRPAASPPQCAGTAPPSGTTGGCCRSRR